MRLTVRLFQPATLTAVIPPAVSWEKPRCLAQTVQTAGTARNRQQAREQIRALRVGQRCSDSIKTASKAPSVALGFPKEHWWSWQSCSCSFQTVLRAWSVAPVCHWIKAFGAATHGVSHGQARADSCLNQHCSSGTDGTSLLAQTGSILEGSSCHH